MLLPLWARGKSNKIELMGVWSFRAQRVGFADRHWWVVVVVEMRRMELGPLSAWQSSRAKLLLSTADGEPMSGLQCVLGGPRPTKNTAREVTAMIYYAIRNTVCLHMITVLV